MLVGSWPGGHALGGTDCDSDNGGLLVVFDDGVTPCAQHREHPAVRDQDIRLEVRDASGSCRLDQRIEQVRP
jgi:hypothetical protein